MYNYLCSIMYPLRLLHHCVCFFDTRSVPCEWKEDNNLDCGDENIYKKTWFLDICRVKTLCRQNAQMTLTTWRTKVTRNSAFNKTRLFLGTVLPCTAIFPNFPFSRVVWSYRRRSISFRYTRYKTREERDGPPLRPRHPRRKRWEYGGTWQLWPQEN